MERERDEGNSENDGAELEAEMRAEMQAEYEAEMRAEMPSRAEIAEWERSVEEHARIQEQRGRADAELPEFSVSWGRITLGDVNALEQAIQTAEREEDIQQFLTQNKQFLIQHLSGGHGRYVLPKPQLGGTLVPDYLLVSEDSTGLHWQGVELESVAGNLFKSKGEPTAALTHAIHQVIDWREWLKNNIKYAQAPKAEGGGGLVGIDGELPATILMGRRRQYPPRFNAFRRHTEQKSRIAIHSYDWLVDEARGRAIDLQQNNG